MGLGSNDVDEAKGGDWNSDNSKNDDIVRTENITKHVHTSEVILEPRLGMEFNSEDDAIRFYNSYAKRVGFLTCVMQRKSSEIDGRSTLGRQCHLGCNHKGLTTASGDSTKLGEMGQPEISCKASIQFKHLEKSGKWVVSRFVKDHNHPLVPVNALDNTNAHEKAKRLHELSQELQRQEELRAAYRDSLINLLANIDKEADHFSSKVLAIVQNVRKAEAEALTLAITP